MQVGFESEKGAPGERVNEGVFAPKLPAVPQWAPMCMPYFSSINEARTFNSLAPESKKIVGAVGTTRSARRQVGMGVGLPRHRVNGGREQLFAAFLFPHALQIDDGESPLKSPSL